MLSFLLRADELYLLARFSYRAFLQYQTFRMAHHSIEYYLKAGLCTKLKKTQMKKLGHNIKKLWKEYKDHVPNINIDNRIITYIDQFETMRYPGMSNYTKTVFGISYNELFSNILNKVPEEVQNTLACFSLNDFDELVFTLRNSLPGGKELPFITVSEDAQMYLFFDNKYFKKEGLYH